MFHMKVATRTSEAFQVQRIGQINGPSIFSCTFSSAGLGLQLHKSKALLFVHARSL